MTLVSQTLQYAISGLTSGSIYAIVGICWSIVFLISGVLNFATGEFVMLGGMLTWYFAKSGLGLGMAAGLAIMCTCLVAILLERLVISPIKHGTEMMFMLVTIASASVIRGLVLISCGTETRAIKPIFEAKSVNVMGATIMPQAIFVMGVLGVVMLGLYIFLNYTLFGKALRASSINRTGAELFGINVSRFRLFCFGLAGGMGALAGVIITPISFTGYNIGLVASLKGLVVSIVGGWGIGGTVLSGLALGLLEGFVAGFVSTGWGDALSLGLMVVFLIVRTFDFKEIQRRFLIDDR